MVNKLNVAIHAALLAPAVSGILQRDGYIPDTLNPEQTAAYFRKEVEVTGEAVKAAGIEAN